MEEARFQSKDKFRIKKLSNTGVMNISAGDWKAKQGEALANAPKIVFNSKASQPNMSKDITFEAQEVK